MSLQKISLRSVGDGTVVKAYRRVENDYGIDPDNNQRIVIGQRVSYLLDDGEALNSSGGITFTSISGVEYVIVK